MMVRNFTFWNRSRALRSKSKARRRKSASRDKHWSSGTLLGIERLEERWVLSADPVLSVVGHQLVDEGSLLSIPVIATFTDVVEGDADGGGTIGLDPMAFTSLGAFDPLANMVIDTDTLTIADENGVFWGVGTIENANAGYGDYEIAVFAFSDFKLDYGLTITAFGSRPLALLSHGDMTIAGTIDGSAKSDGETLNGERLAGPGGGDGGWGNLDGVPSDGSPAAGAPADSVGVFFKITTGLIGGGTGGGFGGDGGMATGFDGDSYGPGGQAFANLSLGIQGGSGGATAGSGINNIRAGGGGGGGGIELGATGTLTIASTGQILVNGGKGANGPNISSNVGGGGGGAGGGILIHAANVNQHGLLSARGGDAGRAPRDGGGGGGGAILIAYQLGGTFDNTGGIQDVSGGDKGQNFSGQWELRLGHEGDEAITEQSPSQVPVIEAFDFVIDWGDGSPLDTGAPTINVPGVNIGDVVEGSFGGSHTYNDNGSYTVTVTINDDRGGSTVDTFQVTVLNVAPTATLLNDGPVDEGSAATVSFADPFDPSLADTAAGFRYAYDFGNNGVWDVGDGSYAGSVGDAGQAVPTSLLEDGPATVTVRGRIIDKDGGFTDYTTVIEVLNVAPTINDATFELVENSPQGTVVGSLPASDPGVHDVLSFSIVSIVDAMDENVDVGTFSIQPSDSNPRTAVITVADPAALDFETSPVLIVEVEVSDGDGGFDTALVTIELLNQPSIFGVVFLDVNQNGVFDANEPGIDAVTIHLLDDLGNPVLDAHGDAITAITSDGGFFLFEDLDPGAYQLLQEQPTGVEDGFATLGTIDGQTSGEVIHSNLMRLELERIDAFDYAFAEFGQQVTPGDAAGVGFWQNKQGQALITQGGPALAAWLTNTFPNVFGNTFDGADGSDVAAFYRDELFKQKGKKSAGPVKIDAHFMATALATFFTSRSLAGEFAASYGFTVTDIGIGARVVNVGASGAAFGVADGTDLTIMQLLLATNSLTDPDGLQSGFATIYDVNGDGSIDEYEALLRAMAFDVYSAINVDGGV